MNSSKRIKTLFVAEAAGGVDRYLKSLFKYMDRDKFENIFVCSQNYDAAAYYQLVDHVIQIPMAHEINRVADQQAVKLIRQAIHDCSPDVVYSQSSKAGALLRLADLGIKNKVLYNPHGWSFNMRTNAKKKVAYRWIEKVQVPFTDKIVCISEAEKLSALREHICKEDKLVVINNGIDLEEINSAPRITRADAGIPDDAFVVGMVGRITEQKAPDVFIEAANLIKQNIPNAFFVIVGDTIAGSDDMKNKVNSLVRKYGLEVDVLITGWVDNPTAYARLFDVGLLLSRWEGFGLAVPEYMACGVPVIATNVDALPYLVKDGETGLLVPMDDYKSAAEDAIKLYGDCELRSSLIKNGKEEVIDHFDVRRTAAETERLIMDVVIKDASLEIGGGRPIA